MQAEPLQGHICHSLRSDDQAEHAPVFSLCLPSDNVIPPTTHPWRAGGEQHGKPQRPSKRQPDKNLIFARRMAHPTGFEPVTSAFGARHLSAKYLNLLQRMLINQHERIGNITELSGNNPEAFRTRTDFFGDVFLTA